MNPVNLKLVTIICEPVLSSTLILLAQDEGASGFTLTEVRGEGSGNKSAGEVPDSKMKIEILASSDLAKKIIARIAETYFDDYSLITYSTDVSVLRPEKF